jgi:hypothetical protein
MRELTSYKASAVTVQAFDMTLLSQGLRTQLDHLERREFELLGEDVFPDVCVECYCERDECSCSRPLFWPLTSAVLKLKSELGR